MTRRSAVVLVTVLLLSACSTADRAAARDAPTTTVAGAMSVPEYYDTVEDLVANASLIVEVMVSDEVDEEAISSSTFAVTTVTVTQVLSEGETAVAAGDEVRVRYTGRTTELYEGMPGPLVAGDRYILFLEPFTFGDGRDTGQWVVVPPGQWRGQAKGHAFELDIVGGAEPMSQLPDVLDPAELAVN